MADRQGLSGPEVEAALRRMVVSGQPGSRLPGQTQLAEQYGVARDTVQRALRKLRDEGLIKSRQGSGSFIAERDPATPDEDGADYAKAQPALIALEEPLARALEASDVTIDYWGFTAETLNTLLTPRLARMRLDGVHRPASLRIRLLLPDLNAPLALPCSVEDPDDPRPLQRLRLKSESLNHDLQTVVEELRRRKWVPDASVEIRSVRMTPQVKLYILNHDVALRGWYEVIDVPVGLPVAVDDPDGPVEEVVIHDLRGLDAPVIPQQPEAVAAARRWFESVWGGIAVPV